MHEPHPGNCILYHRHRTLPSNTLHHDPVPLFEWSTLSLTTPLLTQKRYLNVYSRSLVSTARTGIPFCCSRRGKYCSAIACMAMRGMQTVRELDEARCNQWNSKSLEGWMPS